MTGSITWMAGEDELGNLGASKPIVFCIDGDKSGNCTTDPNSECTAENTPATCCIGPGEGNCIDFDGGTEADTIRDTNCISSCGVQDTYAFVGGVIAP